MTQIEKIKEYVNHLYWDLYYTVGFSSMAGLSNGIADTIKGDDFSDAFGEGYVNHFTLGIAINLLHSPILSRLKSSNHY